MDEEKINEMQMMSLSHFMATMLTTKRLYEEAPAICYMQNETHKAAIKELMAIMNEKLNPTPYKVKIKSTGYMLFAQIHNKGTDMPPREDAYGPYATKEEAEDAWSKLDGYDAHITEEQYTYTVIDENDNEVQSYTKKAQAYAKLCQLAQPEHIMRYYHDWLLTH